ncbi:hypothetical protein QAD02_004063 [Eretmocerus hayati]|uniref:Uncharacterized protein n=1 Tax=Eretmocerus hayati TaxID=131215 RepID=A0ACC2NNQ2_9HYME|nr:hypothetical protein QAD02_004063 [Eretmocerus hayati]
MKEIICISSEDENEPPKKIIKTSKPNKRKRSRLVDNGNIKKCKNNDSDVELCNPDDNKLIISSSDSENEQKSPKKFSKLQHAQKKSIASGADGAESSPKPGTSKYFDKIEKKSQDVDSESNEEDLQDATEGPSSSKKVIKPQLIVKEKVTIPDPLDDIFANLIKTCEQKRKDSQSIKAYSHLQEMYDEMDPRYKNNEEKHIKKIEAAIEECRVRITELEEREVDFEDDDDSAYIREDRYKRRYIQLCKMLSDLVEDQVLKKQIYKRQLKRKDITDEMTGISSVDQDILDFVNASIREVNKLKHVENFNKMPDYIRLPDYVDVLGCIEKSNKKRNLDLSKKKMEKMAQSAFKAVGNYLKMQRIQESRNYLHDLVNDDVDPATTNSELREKLQVNKKKGDKNLDEIFKKYVNQQEGLSAEDLADNQADETSDSSDSDGEAVNDDEDDENERKERRNSTSSSDDQDHENKDSENEKEVESEEACASKTDEKVTKDSDLEAEHTKKLSSNNLLIEEHGEGTVSNEQMDNFSEKQNVEDLNKDEASQSESSGRKSPQDNGEVVLDDPLTKYQDPPVDEQNVQDFNKDEAVQSESGGRSSPQDNGEVVLDDPVTKDQDSTVDEQSVEDSKKDEVVQCESGGSSSPQDNGEIVLDDPLPSDHDLPVDDQIIIEKECANEIADCSLSESDNPKSTGDKADHEDVIVSDGNTSKNRSSPIEQSSSNEPVEILEEISNKEQSVDNSLEGDPSNEITMVSISDDTVINKGKKENSVIDTPASAVVTDDTCKSQTEDDTEILESIEITGEDGDASEIISDDKVDDSASGTDSSSIKSHFIKVAPFAKPPKHWGESSPEKMKQPSKTPNLSRLSQYSTKPDLVDLTDEKEQPQPRPSTSTKMPNPMSSFVRNNVQNLVVVKNVVNNYNYPNRPEHSRDHPSSMLPKRVQIVRPRTGVTITRVGPPQMNIHNRVPNFPRNFIRGDHVKVIPLSTKDKDVRK